MNENLLKDATLLLMSYGVFEQIFYQKQLFGYTMMETMLPLRDIMEDDDYAWELLESQIKLELAEEVTGQDLSHLVHLYMKGVEKMNSVLDMRQSFFKTRLNSLMAKQEVRRSLDNSMNKKKKPYEAETSPIQHKIAHKKQLQLRQKKAEIEMRLAYGTEEHSPKAVREMITEQTHRQEVLSSRIEKIIDGHEERLLNRIKERKLRTMTAKSRSDIFLIHNIEMQGLTKKQILEKKRDEQQFGNHLHIAQEKTPTRKLSFEGDRQYKSLQYTKKQRSQESPKMPGKARRISADFGQLQIFRTPEKVR